MIIKIPVTLLTYGYVEVEIEDNYSREKLKRIIENGEYLDKEFVQNVDDTNIELSVAPDDYYELNPDIEDIDEDIRYILKV